MQIRKQQTQLVQSSSFGLKSVDIIYELIKPVIALKVTLTLKSGWFEIKIRFLVRL